MTRLQWEDREFRRKYYKGRAAKLKQDYHDSGDTPSQRSAISQQKVRYGIYAFCASRPRKNGVTCWA